MSRSVKHLVILLCDRLAAHPVSPSPFPYGPFSKLSLRKRKRERKGKRDFTCKNWLNEDFVDTCTIDPDPRSVLLPLLITRKKGDVLERTM